MTDFKKNKTNNENNVQTINKTDNDSGNQNDIKKSLAIGVKPVITNTQLSESATMAKSATGKPKIKTVSKSKMAKVTSKLKAKPNTPAKTKSSQKNSSKDLPSKQGDVVYDLNSNIGYPIHPNRIWPD